MSERERDIFEQVADMIVEEDFLSGPKTPSFVELLRLQFSQPEARLALHIRTTGATLAQLAERTKISPDKLKKMLHTMADKGTVFHDSGPDPVFKIVKMAGPGWVETSIWAGIKHSKSVRMAKAINQVMKDWTTEKMSQLGFPYTVVWPGAGTLPADADPAYDLAEASRNAGAWSVSYCPCRLSHWITEPGEHCDHMLETCIQTGELSRWTVQHGMARALSYEEFVALLGKCSQDGLVLTGGFHNTICNCCNDCCTLFYGEQQGQKVFIPAPFLAEVDDESCNGCNDCTKACPVGAITGGEEGEMYVSVDAEKCIGCGVCVNACAAGFMRLISHARPEADEQRARMLAIAAQLETH